MILISAIDSETPFSCAFLIIKLVKSSLVFTWSFKNNKSSSENDFNKSASLFLIKALFNLLVISFSANSTSWTIILDAFSASASLSPKLSLVIF